LLQQGTDAVWFFLVYIGFFQHQQLVAGGEGAPLGFGSDFWVWLRNSYRPVLTGVPALFLCHGLALAFYTKFEA
jgi:hypothetical protein